MYHHCKTSAFLGILLAAALLFPLKLTAEFYKYVDENGHLHFVDDQSKIPLEYIDKADVYKEKYDHLSEEERSLRLENDTKKAAEIQRQREAQEALLKKMELIKKRKQEEIAKENYLKSLQTDVTIDGNRVLVPVKLGYRGREVEALLLLDTGATITTLHDDIVEQLFITQSKKAAAKVVSGKVVDFRVATLNYIKVGSLKLENALVGIIKHTGPSVGHNGLLGMNFLRHFDYSIDFEKQIINWKP